MGGTLSCLAAQKITLPTPLSDVEVEKLVKVMPHQPSEALKVIWQSVGSGTVDCEFPFKIAAPECALDFPMDEFDGFDGIKQITKTSNFPICTLWTDTDSRTPIYEVADGEYKGHLIAFPYSNLEIFISQKTTADLIEAAKNPDPSKIFQTLFDGVKPLPPDPEEEEEEQGQK